MALEREIATYQREKARLLAEGEHGRYALIHGDAVASVWDTWRDASQAGYEKFGLESFMIQEIREIERPILITRLIVPNGLIARPSKEANEDDQQSYYSHPGSQCPISREP
jgi:hypothetical protein